MMAFDLPARGHRGGRFVPERGAEGDALTKALEEKDWDPSVEGLTQFPDLLKRMSENLDWTKDLGDAFLGQKDDIFAAVQRMRGRAQEAGTLKTSKEQTVTKEVVNNKETIIIQPTDPQARLRRPTCRPGHGSDAVHAPPAPYYPAIPRAAATASLFIRRRVRRARSSPAAAIATTTSPRQQ
jgi:hypothetical protein